VGTATGNCLRYDVRVKKSKRAASADASSAKAPKQPQTMKSAKSASSARKGKSVTAASAKVTRGAMKAVDERSNAQVAPAPAGRPNSDISSWADVVEQSVPRAIIEDSEARRLLEAVGLPWRVRHRVTGIDMVLIPPGQFVRRQQGPTQDPETHRFYQAQFTDHIVVIGRPFYLAQTETTQQVWRMIMKKDPSKHRMVFRKRQDLEDMISVVMDAERLSRTEAEIFCGPHPVDSVTWHECQEFASRTGLRLPTEAEWEWACHMGRLQPTGKALETAGWSKGSRDSRAVGTKPPNVFGLHDMHGNLREWCQDAAERSGSWFKSCRGTVVDPTGPDASAITPPPLMKEPERVLRGNCWFFGDGDRHAETEPDYRRVYTGVRVACSAVR
jgi:formylglycine-generating enzyme required for sulfatase activity